MSTYQSITSQSRKSATARQRKCPHCMEEYGTREIAYHIKKCEKNPNPETGFDRKQNNIRQSKSAAAISRSSPTSRNPSTPKRIQNEHPIKCQTCGLSFYSDRIAKHMELCRPKSPPKENPIELQTSNNDQYFNEIPKHTDENEKKKDVKDMKLVNKIFASRLRNRRRTEGAQKTQALDDKLDPALEKSLSRLLVGQGKRTQRARTRLARVKEITMQKFRESEDTQVTSDQNVEKKESFQGSFNNQKKKSNDDGGSFNKISWPSQVEDKMPEKKKEHSPEIIKKPRADSPTCSPIEAEPVSALTAFNLGSEMTPPQNPQAKKILNMDDVPVGLSQGEISPPIRIKVQSINELPETVDAEIEMEKCPFCQRSFRTDVAARHIPKCQFTKNRPKPPSKSVKKKTFGVKSKSLAPPASKKEATRPPLGKKLSANEPSGQIIVDALVQKEDRPDAVTPPAKSTASAFFHRIGVQLHLLKEAKDSVDQLKVSTVMADLKNSKISRNQTPRRHGSRGSFQNQSPARSPLLREAHGNQNDQLTQSLEIPKLNIYNDNVQTPKAQTERSQPRQVEQKVFLKRKQSQPGAIQVMPSQKANVIRKGNNNEAQREQKKKIDHSDVGTRALMFSHIQCPACNRKFGKKAADAHIKYCMEKAEKQKYQAQSQRKKPVKAVKSKVLAQTAAAANKAVTQAKPKTVKSRIDTGLNSGRPRMSRMVTSIHRQVSDIRQSMEQTQNINNDEDNNKYYEDSEDNECEAQWSFRTNTRLLPNAPEGGLSTSFNSDHPASRLRLTTSRASTQHRPLSRGKQVHSRNHNSSKTETGYGGIFKRYYDGDSYTLTRQSQEKQQSTTLQYSSMKSEEQITPAKSNVQEQEQEQSFEIPKVQPKLNSFQPRAIETAKQGYNKFCTNCGYKFENVGHKFCGECGVKRKIV